MHFENIEGRFFAVIDWNYTAYCKVRDQEVAGSTDDVALLVNGTLSTMRALKMLPGQPRYIKNPVWLEKIVDMISDGPGIWYPLVKHGTYVQEGMKLGYVTDYFGKVILEPRAPAAGVVLHVNAVPSLKKRR